MKWIRRLFIGLLGLVALLAIAAIAIVLLVPASFYEEQIEKQASAALGRTVTIDGAPDFQLLPTRLKVRGMTIANEEGFPSDYFATVDEADIGIRLLPLFSKRLEITKFVLKEPAVNLEMKADGTANWILGKPAAASPVVAMRSVMCVLAMCGWLMVGCASTMGRVKPIWRRMPT